MANDIIRITMKPEQCRMARASLKWTIDNLAHAAGVARMTVVRFERGDGVTADSVAAMRSALEAKRVRFIDSGKFAGGVTRVSVARESTS